MGGRTNAEEMSVHLPWRGMPVGDDGLLVSTSLTANESAPLEHLAAGRDVLEVGSALASATSSR